MSKGSSHSFFFLAFGRTVGVHTGWRSDWWAGNEMLVNLVEGIEVGLVRNGGIDLGKRDVVAIDENLSFRICD